MAQNKDMGPSSPIAQQEQEPGAQFGGYASPSAFMKRLEQEHEPVQDAEISNSACQPDNVNHYESCAGFETKAQPLHGEAVPGSSCTGSIGQGASEAPSQVTLPDHDFYAVFGTDIVLDSLDASIDLLCQQLEHDTNLSPMLQATNLQDFQCQLRSLLQRAKSGSDWSGLQYDDSKIRTCSKLLAIALRVALHRVPLGEDALIAAAGLLNTELQSDRCVVNFLEEVRDYVSIQQL